MKTETSPCMKKYAEAYDIDVFNKIQVAVGRAIGVGRNEEPLERMVIMNCIRDACLNLCGASGRSKAFAEVMKWAYHNLRVEEYMMLRDYILSFNTTSDYKSSKELILSFNL